MQKDTVQYVRRCEKCQIFAPAIHKPTSQLNLISSPWPFAQWGLDLVGPLPRAIGNRQWLIVATDYFTKWVEAEPLECIMDSESRKLFWKNIITLFGILDASSLTMARSLTADHSGSSAQSSKLEIISPARPTHRETDRQSLPIKKSSSELRKG